MDQKTLDAYNGLNLTEKKYMLELLLGKDVIVWSPETQQVDCAEDIFDIDDVYINGNAVQLTLMRT
jgi:hypothetical protein